MVSLKHKYNFKFGEISWLGLKFLRLGELRCRGYSNNNHEAKVKKRPGSWLKENTDCLLDYLFQCTYSCQRFCSVKGFVPLSLKSAIQIKLLLINQLKPYFPTYTLIFGDHEQQ